MICARKNFLAERFATASFEKTNSAGIGVNGRRQFSICQASGRVFDENFCGCLSLGNQAPIAQGHFRERGRADSNGIPSARFDPKHLLLETPDNSLANLLEDELIVIHGLR